MSLQEHVTVVASHDNNLAFESTCYMIGSASTCVCRICLWEFEGKSELDIHNSLEHMIINHTEHKRNIEHSPIIQV
jgi:hypothetical protein